MPRSVVFDVQLPPTCATWPYAEAGRPPGALLAGAVNLVHVSAQLQSQLTHVKQLYVTFRTLRTEPGQDDLVLFALRLGIATLPTLEPGIHAWPAIIELPAWLPEAWEGPALAIVHEVKVELDVDWALDPHALFVIPVVRPPGQGVIRETVVPIPPPVAGDDTLVARLPSTVFSRGALLQGTISMADLPHAPCGSTPASVCITVRTVIGANKSSSTAESSPIVVSTTRVQEAPVPFSIDLSALTVSTLGPSLEVSHELVLACGEAGDAYAQPAVVRFGLLPRGSHLVAAPTPRQAAVVSLTHLEREPINSRGTFVAEGLPLVDVRLTERETSSGLVMTAVLAFPDLEIGLGLSGRSLEAMAKRPFLKRAGLPISLVWDPTLTPMAESAWAPLFRGLFSNLGMPRVVELSDTHLTVEAQAHNASERDAFVAATQRSAAIMSTYLAELPIPYALRPEVLAQWRRIAAKEAALFLPHRPGLFGLARRVTLVGGQEHVLPASLVTRWLNRSATLVLEIGLQGISDPIIDRIEAGVETPAMHGLGLALFFAANDVLQRETFRAYHAGSVDDPSDRLRALDLIATWIQELAHEEGQGPARVSSRPYR